MLGLVLRWSRHELANARVPGISELRFEINFTRRCTGVTGSRRAWEWWYRRYFWASTGVVASLPIRSRGEPSGAASLPG